MFITDEIRGKGEEGGKVALPDRAREREENQAMESGAVANAPELLEHVKVSFRGRGNKKGKGSSRRGLGKKV